MFTSLDEISDLGNNGFRKLGDLELEQLYRITEDKKITTRSGEKVCLDLEGFGRVLLTERLKRIVTKEILQERSDQ